MLEQLAAYEERASCAEAEQVLEQAFEHALGRTLDELDGDELDRVIQLLREAPDHAHPLLVRTCLTRPEDREPAQPAGKYCRQIPGQGTQWFTPDTDEWRIYSQWWRRRWGYLTATICTTPTSACCSPGSASTPWVTSSCGAWSTCAPRSTRWRASSQGSRCRSRCTGRCSAGRSTTRSGSVRRRAPRRPGSGRGMAWGAWRT